MQRIVIELLGGPDEKKMGISFVGRNELSEIERFESIASCR